VRYRLPRAQLGAFQVRLRATIEFGASGESKSRSAWTVPLAAALDGKLEASTALVRSAAAGELSVEPGSWRPAALLDRTAAEGLLLETTERASGLTLRQRTASAPSETIVERAWIQSWYLAEIRQERVVLRVRTRAPQFECRLPEEAEPAGLTVSLRSADGGQATDLDTTSVLGPDHRLTIPIPPAARGDDRHVIELRYPCAAAPADAGRTLNPPRVAESVWVQQVCWQLLLPPDEHVVSRPDGFSHEFQWGWRRLYWGRQPTVDQPQLEAWSGGEPTGFVSGDASQYVFSTAGELRPLVFFTARRSTLVLATSLLAFAAGVVLWRTPASRRAQAATLALALVALAALWRPEAAVLAGQAAALGLLLGCVSLWLERRWAVGRPPVRATSPSTWPAPRGSSITRSAPAMASTSSAPSMPAPAEENESEPP
jgi:hypothetical protein